MMKTSVLLVSMVAVCAACVHSVDPPAPIVRAPTTESAPRTPYPIVLVHGISGFSNYGPHIPYFNGVEAALEPEGVVVVEARVPPFDSSLARATVLAAIVDATLAESGAKKVHLIGHSQGGLDSRALVSAHGYADRVASITTISTPHRGSPVADAAVDALPAPILDLTLGAYALALGEPDDVDFPRARGFQGVYTLTSAARAEYDAKYPDDPRVPIFSFAGVAGEPDAVCATGAWGALDAEAYPQAMFVATWTFIRLSEPTARRANDGLVPASSAVWGHFLGCLPADHMASMGYAGMGPPAMEELDYVALMRAYVARLRALERTSDVRVVVENPIALPMERIAYGP
jgi:triacylglycerol lipase